MYKPIPIDKKLKKDKSGFSGPKVLLFRLKSVPYTGNELAGDDYKSLTSLVILY